MKKLLIVLVVTTLVFGCTSYEATNAPTNDSLTSQDAIDSSALINQASRLPNDSVTTGVTH